MRWKTRLIFVRRVLKMLGNLFTGLLSKILLATTLLFLSVASITTYLYLGTRDELTTLKSTYIQLKQDFEEGERSKGKVVEGVRQDDTLLVDKTEKINSLTKDKEALLKRLANIPKCTPTPAGSQNVQINVDDELPVDIISLLNESYNQNKRSSNTSK